MHLIKKCFAFLLITSCVLIINNKSFAQLSKVGFNQDSSQHISLTDFNHRVDRATQLLKTKKLAAISDTDHINIMMCLNTIGFTPILNAISGKRFTGNKYHRLEMIADKKKYVRDIVGVYPDYTYNRGLGFYFPKLKMELYGIPSLYAIFEVGE